MFFLNSSSMGFMNCMLIPWNQHRSAHLVYPGKEAAFLLSGMDFEQRWRVLL
jgi:hypothetical protein